jgi:tRNA threonylcarbamoyladenosine biosynthesis protein TsaB
MILGIETATAVCAAAVAGGGHVFAESSLEEKYIHAERLMSMVDEVLRESGRSLAALDAIAVSIGPGSFTGLRIGLSVAK